MTDAAKPKSRASRDLTEGPVAGHLRRILLPMIIGVTAVMSVSVVDTYFVGQLGALQLAAISFCFPVVITVTSIAIGLGAGASSCVARAAGRKDEDRVHRLVTDALILTTVVIGIVSLAGWFLTDPLFRALGAEDNLIPYIVDYMHTWFAGVIFIAMPIVANGVLRSLGDARAPAAFMVLIAVVNVILDPIFIFGWGPVPAFGVQGAAIVSILANLVGVAAALWLLIFHEKIVAFRPVPIAKLIDSWSEIARIGIPAALSNAINPFGITLATAGFARFGAEAVAGFGVASRIEVFAAIPLLALSASIGPVTGQNGGAGHPERSRRAFQISFAFALFWSLFTAILLAVFAVPVTNLFTDSARTLDVAQLYLWIAPVTVAGYGVVIAASAGFNALGRPLQGMVMTFSRSLIFYAPGVWIGGTLAGIPGAIAGIALANVVSGLATAAWTLLYAPMTAKGARVKPAVSG